MTVLEAADALGGGTRSSELTLPGLIHDECSAAHPLARRHAVLAAVRPRGARPDLALAGGPVRPPARRRRAAPRRGARSSETAAGARRRDGERWRSLFGPLAERFDDITADFLRPMLHVPEHPLRWRASALLLRRCRPRCSRARWSHAGGAGAVRRRRRARVPAVLGADVVGDRRRARHRRAPLRLAGRRGRLGRDQPARWSRCSRSYGAKFETGVRVDSLDELDGARHRDARRRAGGRRADRRRPHAAARSRAR